jgi:hypothetical protein
MRTPSSASAHGSTLVLAMILLAVLSLVGVAAVTLSSRERANVGAKAKRDLQIACANAARSIIYAELARYGPGYLSSPQALPTFTLPDGTVLSQQHYDTAPGMTVKDITPQRILSVSADSKSTGASDLTNTFESARVAGGSVPGFDAVVRCEDSKGRMLEVELVVAMTL